MGTLVEPPTYGNDCVDCFPADETPDFIYITFSGVKVGDNPASRQLENDRIFKCSQLAGFPCEWYYNRGGPGWQIACWKLAGPIRWIVNATYIGEAVYFDGLNVGCPGEFDIWVNRNFSPIFWRGWDGFATIFWMDSIWNLVNAMNFPTDGRLLMETFIKDGDTVIQKFCNAKYHMNQSIEVS